MKIKNLEINEHFKIEGYWHVEQLINENGEHKNVDDWVFGILKKDQYGIFLTVYSDDFYDRQERYEEAQINYIYGLTQKGERITLKNLKRVNLKENFPGFPVYEYIIQEVFVGDFILNTTLFSEVKFSFKFLDLWIKQNIDKRSGDFNNELKKYKVRKINIDNNLKFFDGISLKANTNNPIKYQVKTKKFLALSSKKNLLLDEINFEFRKLWLFLNTIISHYITFDYISYKLVNGNKVTKIFNQDEHLEKQNLTNIPSFEDCYSIMEYALTKWFNNPDFYLLLSKDLFKPKGYRYYLDNFHVEQIRSIEVFHREVYSSNHIDVTEDRDKLLEFINNEIENKEYFKERIEYKGEISLRNRLTEILYSLPMDLQEEISKNYNQQKNTNRGVNKNLKSFINKLVNDRNNYVHNNLIEEVPELNEKYKYLFEESLLLQSIIRYLILKDIGFTDELLLSNDYYYPKIKE